MRNSPSNTWLLIICLLLSTSSYAEVYKWIDAAGRIHYSDKKPENQTTSKMKLKQPVQHSNEAPLNNVPKVSEQPLQPVKKKPKITMYSASWCGYCKQAKAHFKKLKIRFQEYDIENNNSARKRYVKLGGTGVPLLVANNKQMQGFDVAKFTRWYDNL